MAYQFQMRRDTASNWTSANPTLAQGEWGLETNTGKLKLGDGSTAWTSLAYFTSGTASPLTTKGDLYTYSTTNARLPIGSNGQLLIANSGSTTGNKWARNPTNYYIDFANGSDSNSGGIADPWATLAHAYATVGATTPAVFVYSGVGNSSESGTINATSNVSLVGEGFPGIIADFVVNGSSIADPTLVFLNIAFTGNFTITANDTYNWGIAMLNCAVGLAGNPTAMSQSGSGTMEFTILNLISGSDLTLGLGPSGSSSAFIENAAVLADLTFSDCGAGSAAFMVGGLYSGALTASGGITVVLAGMGSLGSFGSSAAFNTTFNGTPVVITSDAALPPTYTGSPLLFFLSQSQYVSYVPTTASNWAVQPATVLQALDNIVTPLNSDVSVYSSAGGGTSNLGAYVLPAGTLAASGESIEIYAAGKFAATANAKELKLIFGSTTILDSGSHVFNGQSWEVKGKIYMTSSTSAEVSSLTFTTSGTLSQTTVLNSTPAEDLTTALTLQFKATDTTAADTVQNIFSVTWGNL